MDATLNLKALLQGDSNRLRYVIRYSTCQRLHPENVAEHSYYVALYAAIITNWVNIGTYPESVVRMGDVLQRALFHDLEEAITGDVNRIFKYSDPHIKNALDRGADTCFRDVMYPIIGNDNLQLYMTHWRSAKDGTYAGRIVKFADYLAVLAYMSAELPQNATMRQNLEIMREYHDIFSEDGYDFIRPLVNQANDILNETFAMKEKAGI